VTRLLAVEAGLFGAFVGAVLAQVTGLVAVVAILLYVNMIFEKSGDQICKVVLPSLTLSAFTGSVTTFRSEKAGR
jgi:hypothetical protein